MGLRPGCGGRTANPAFPPGVGVTGPVPEASMTHWLGPVWTMLSPLFSPPAFLQALIAQAA
jgi:hypothetical protein